MRRCLSFSESSALAQLPRKTLGATGDGYTRPRCAFKDCPTRYGCAVSKAVIPSLQTATLWHLASCARKLATSWSRFSPDSPIMIISVFHHTPCGIQRAMLCANVLHMEAQQRDNHALYIHTWDHFWSYRFLL